MSIFKKKVNFISCDFPKCGGHLDLDESLKSAYCQYCGEHFIVENANKHKETSLDKLIGFIEREDERKKEKKELKLKKEEEEKKLQFKEDCIKRHFDKKAAKKMEKEKLKLEKQQQKRLKNKK